MALAHAGEVFRVGTVQGTGGRISMDERVLGPVLHSNEDTMTYRLQMMMQSKVLRLLDSSRVTRERGAGVVELVGERPRHLPSAVAR